MYLDYREENLSSNRRGGGHSSRFMANVIGASVVGAAAVALIAAAMITSGAAPSPTPRPTAAVLATITPAPTPIPTVAFAQRTAEVQVIVDLPLNVFVPDRAQSPDDGKNIYLTGADGGAAIDPLTGAVGTVFGGEAFTGGVRRSIVAAGSLWVSSWPNSAKQCGSTCWAQATTYRLSIATGKVQKAYPATYLVGLAADGLWLASGDKLQRLDLKTGATKATIPWKATTEPRVGCGGLWSLDIQAKDVILTQIDQATGDASPAVTILPSDATYGPVAVESGCWMMSGYDGISNASTSLYMINKDSGLSVTKTYARTILILDGEFWTYSPGAVVQRLEVGTGTPYGASYQLAVAPSSDDAGLLFGSLGTLWMLDAQQLVEFSVPLGIENSAA
jgi:hypothetical protein